MNFGRMRNIRFSDLKNYWSFYRRAKTIYEVHSPFVYDFITQVLDTSKEYYSFTDIEYIRNNMLSIEKVIERTDFGAGSRTLRSPKVKVKDMVRSGASTPDQGKILYNCAIHCHSKVILELGTNVGIGTAYLAAADKRSRVITIEGDPTCAYLAKRNFELLGLNNIDIINNEMTTALDNLLESGVRPDLVFMDGNHQYEATIKYFHMLLPQMNDDSIILIDDIYWSSGMANAWKQISAHESVSIAIDTFKKGFAFINNTLVKEKIRHTHVRTSLKPWKIGLFS